MQDEIREVPQKMIRRHPHIFAKRQRDEYAKDREIELISSMTKAIDSLRMNAKREIKERDKECMRALFQELSNLRNYDLHKEE